MQCYAVVRLAIKAIYRPFRQVQFCYFAAKPSALSIKRRWLLSGHLSHHSQNETDYMKIGRFYRSMAAGMPGVRCDFIAACCSAWHFGVWQFGARQFGARQFAGLAVRRSFVSNSVIVVTKVVEFPRYAYVYSLQYLLRYCCIGGQTLGCAAFPVVRSVLSLRRHHA